MPIGKNYPLNILLIIISFLIINCYILIDLFVYCTHHLLLVQPNFAFQKYEIREFITKSLVIYYPKYYCKLNHIEYFQYNAKK